MDALTSGQWALALAGALIVGVSKTGLPGMGILAIPLFAAILPARASTGVVLPMLLVGDVVAVAVYRHHAEWKHLWRLFPWTITGVVAGYLLLGRLDDRQLRPLIGGLVLALLILNQLRLRLPRLDARIPTQRWEFAAVMGLLAGSTTMLANAAGPIMTIYLLAMGLPKTAFIGTGAWYFLLMNGFKVPFSAHLGLINASSLQFNALLAPVILVGAGLGLLLARRIPERAFGWTVQALAALGALRLLVG